MYLNKFSNVIFSILIAGLVMLLSQGTASAEDPEAVPQTNDEAEPAVVEVEMDNRNEVEPAVVEVEMDNRNEVAPTAYVDAGTGSNDEVAPETPTATIIDVDPDTPRFAALIGPAGLALGLVFGIVAIAPNVQIGLHDYVALDIVPSFTYLYGEWAEVEYMGGGGALGVRIFPLGTGLRGFYIVPRVMFSYLEATTGILPLSTTTVTPTIEAGYSWIWNHFVLNVGGGGGWNFVVAGENFYKQEDRTPFALVLNASIGFAI